MVKTPDIILFTYDISVYGRKIEWYLILRCIPYSICTVRNRLPREQLVALGIKYRRIPVLVIGRDVYCDTRLIIHKLETLFPGARLGSNQPSEQAIEYLVESWINDAGPFWRTSSLIPPTAEVMKDPEWIKDRTEMTGNTFNKDVLAYLRPDGLVHQRIYWQFVEDKLLGDGRKYILGGNQPTLADLHALWLFDWVLQDKMKMLDYLEKDVISDKLYPKTFAWVHRSRQYLSEAQQKQGNTDVLPDDVALVRILRADFYENVESFIDTADPLKLKSGQLVKVWPTDSGQAPSHRDRGKLFSLDVREVVIESEMPNGQGCLRLHFPRTNFKVQAVKQEKL